MRQCCKYGTLDQVGFVPPGARVKEASPPTNPSQEAHELVKQAGGGGQLTSLCSMLITQWSQSSGLQLPVGDFLSPEGAGWEFDFGLGLHEHYGGVRRNPAKESAPT